MEVYLFQLQNVSQNLGYGRWQVLAPGPLFCLQLDGEDKQMNDNYLLCNAVRATADSIPGYYGDADRVPSLGFGWDEEVIESFMEEVTLEPSHVG
jgi:hypothetical protein